MLTDDFNATDFSDNGFPIDSSFSSDGDYFYVLGGSTPAVYVYEVNDCNITEIQVQTEGVALPGQDLNVSGVAGLAIFD